MITHEVTKRLRYIPTVNAFSTPFTGLYDFNIVSGNVKQTVCELQPGSVYFIDNFTIGGNIAKEDYLNAISVMPELIFYRKRTRQIVYQNPIPIPHFFEEKAATLFVYTTGNADELQLTLRGQISQTAALIGIDPLKITVSISLFVTDDPKILQNFLDINPVRKI